MKWFQNSIIIFFLVFISSLGFITVWKEDESFSQLENRYLTERPIFSWGSFFSGEFTANFEEYIKDQLVWKEEWILLKSDIERIFLKQENNGIYFGKESYLFEPLKEPGEQLSDNISYINEFVRKTENVTSYIMLVPTSVSIYEEKLPPFVESYNQNELLDSIQKKLNKDIEVIDINNELIDRKTEYIYFRTDHHWTMRGAYYAYVKAAKYLQVEPLKLNDFSIEVMSENFFGSFYTKAASRRILPDKMEVFSPNLNIDYTVTYYDQNKVASSLYELDFLKGKDKYGMFLNGNHSLVTITSSLKNGRKLAVIKDSYAHTFLPFLANHFEEIHVLDLRYYHMNLNDYLQEESIEEVLFLYNLSNFATDRNMFWLIQ